MIKLVLVASLVLIGGCNGPQATPPTSPDAFSSTVIPITPGEKTEGEILVPDVRQHATHWRFYYPVGAVDPIISAISSDGADLGFSVADSCVEDAGYVDCLVKLPMLEARSGGVWHLTVSGLAEGELFVEVTLESDAS